MLFACRYSLLFPVIFHSCYISAMTAVTGLRCVWAEQSFPPERHSTHYLATVIFTQKLHPKITRLAFIYNLSKINIAIWEVISHLWFLLTLALLTGICFYWFKKIKNNASTNSFFVNKINNIGKVSLLLLLYVLGYSMIRKMLFILNREILFNSVFNFFFMETLFYLPFLFSVLTALFIHKLNRYLLYFHLALFWHHYCYFSLTTQTNTLILLIFFL